VGEMGMEMTKGVAMERDKKVEMWILIWYFECLDTACLSEPLTISLARLSILALRTLTRI
jgi:hypothetical protein